MRPLCGARAANRWVKKTLLSRSICQQQTNIKLKVDAEAGKSMGHRRENLFKTAKKNPMAKSPNSASAIDHFDRELTRSALAVVHFYL